MGSLQEARKGNTVAIDFKNHKFVMIIATNDVSKPIHLGFDRLATAGNVIEQQVDEDKALSMVADALSEDGAEIEGVTYLIMDIAAYVDTFVDDEDDE